MSIIFNGHYRVKHRTWLLEVLRLHFEEKLPRIEAGRRLGIPKTTACDLFVRFRKAGLSWPLPPRINAKNLDKRLYRQDSRKSSGLPVVPAPCEIPVARKRTRRPNFPRDFKIALVAQSMQPGVSVAQLARENNINDNLLFNWRRRYQQELQAARAEEPLMLPVTLAAEPGPEPTHPPSVLSDAPCCELVLPAGTLRISGKLTPELLQMLIREMQGGCR
ncbi:TPA: transposase [Salmonella enterica]|nr:IS66-like element accessory protein TnpA [Salmonella enterica]MCH5736177.1 IS66-like element accessory protein TnpA [Salmonella enterica]MCH5745325.1 IS66-like element accessory protein TnpA [Salmonella enterica]MCH5745900.1 IS66-like element accessory protein TnpA [Salmonella enterica]MCH5755072.1 IS66-like element accessory protein TnpA [Salmonella enterica]